MKVLEISSKYIYGATKIMIRCNKKTLVLSVIFYVQFDL